MKTVGRVAAIFLLVCIGGASTAAGPETVYVQVAEARLRREPSFLSPSVGVAAFGEPLAKLGESGPWFRVSREQRIEGWVHGSALTAMRLVLKPGEEDVQVGTGRAEPTLAGKGFSAETEAGLKTKRPGLDFAVLDELEASVPADEEVIRFAHDGGLR